MRVVVVGAGAMGGLFGSRLSAVGHDVILHDIWSEHVRAIRRDGLKIDELDGSAVNYRIPATEQAAGEAENADLLLVEVKAYDTCAALEPYAGIVGDRTIVLSLQNGLGNLEQIHQALPGHSRVALGTSAHGSTVIGPGHLKHAGRGPNVIGVPADSAGLTIRDLEPVRDALTSAGFETEISGDVESMIWRKLMANVAINAVSALTGVLIGELLKDPELFAISEAAVREAEAVMRAARIASTDEDFVAYARHIMEVTARNQASMLQDVRLGRRTEIDAINGAVARLAEQHGLSAPINRTLAALVRQRERSDLFET